jgi:dsDNA-specific endonuclease/ATPase MutS2
VTLYRSTFRVAVVAAVLLIGTLAAGGCKKEDQAQVNQKLDELSKEAQQKMEEAKPRVEAGVRDAQKAVGKGVEAAGELIQKGGEELQKKGRDTSNTTLPDTLTPDTARPE